MLRRGIRYLFFGKFELKRLYKQKIGEQLKYGFVKKSFFKNESLMKEMFNSSEVHS